MFSKTKTGMARLFISKRLRRKLPQYPLINRLSWAAEAAPAAALWALSGALGLDRGSAVGSFLGARIGPRLRKHAHVVENLRVVLPELGEAELQALAVEVWREFGRAVAEQPHLEQICRDPGKGGRIEVVFASDEAAAAVQDAPVILVSAHMANWQIAAGVPPRVGLPFSVVYSPPSNPYIGGLLYRSRKALRCGLIDLATGAREVMRALQSGTSVGMLIDQRFDGGELVEFFGRPAPTATVPARLALKAGVPLLPARPERLDGARFRLTVYSPIRPKDALATDREKALQMTRQVNALFETWITERPEQWLCPKRRWPKQNRMEAGSCAMAAA